MSKTINAGLIHPSFLPSPTFSPSSDALAISDLVDVVHRVVADPVQLPSVGSRRWLEGCVPVALCNGRLLLTIRAVHPARLPFLPGPLSSSLHTSHSSSIVCAVRKCFNPIKNLLELGVVTLLF